MGWIEDLWTTKHNWADNNLKEALKHPESRVWASAPCGRQQCRVCADGLEAWQKFSRDLPRADTGPEMELAINKYINGKPGIMDPQTNKPLYGKIPGAVDIVEHLSEANDSHPLIPKIEAHINRWKELGATLRQDYIKGIEGDTPTADKERAILRTNKKQRLLSLLRNNPNPLATSHDEEEANVRERLRTPREASVKSPICKWCDGETSVEFNGEPHCAPGEGCMNGSEVGNCPIHGSFHNHIPTSCDCGITGGTEAF